MSEVECICTCARAHLRTMVPPCPLVHRRSRRHTGSFFCDERGDLERLYYERSAKRGASLLLYTGEKVSMSGRPAGRPAVVTLFERLYLWNGMTNSRTVILITMSTIESIMYLTGTDTHRCLPTARGTCRGEGVGDGDTLSLGNSRNGWPDCVQIWCVTRDPLDKCFPHV